ECVTMRYCVAVQFEDRLSTLGKAYSSGIIVVLVNHPHIPYSLNGLVSIGRHFLRRTANEDLHYLSKPAVIVAAHHYLLDRYLRCKMILFRLSGGDSYTYLAFGAERSQAVPITKLSRAASTA